MCPVKDAFTQNRSKFQDVGCKNWTIARPNFSLEWGQSFEWVDFADGQIPNQTGGDSKSERPIAVTGRILSTCELMTKWRTRQDSNL